MHLSNYEQVDVANDVESETKMPSYASISRQRVPLALSKLPVSKCKEEEARMILLSPCEQVILAAMQLNSWSQTASGKF